MGKTDMYKPPTYDSIDQSASKKTFDPIIMKNQGQKQQPTPSKYSSSKQQIDNKYGAWGASYKNSDYFKSLHNV